MNFNLSHIRMSKSRNGLSMSAKFYINGIACADFEDKGNGSEPTFYIYLNDEAMYLFTKWEAGLDTLPEIYIPAYEMEMKIDKSLFIDLLHAAIVNKQSFKLLAA